MRRKRIFRDDFHPRACNGKRTLRGYTKSGNPENVVVIDVDDDNHPDVIIIDDPDSLEPREREVPLHKVISIDDEDSDVDHPGVGVPCVGELDSDATSSKRSFPSQEFSGSPLDFDVDQFRTVQREKSSSKASKCQKSYVGKTPCRNRYGLSPESEEGSSESDCSDCEVLEGSSEELREQWERTYSKQKGKSFNCRYGIDDRASTSTFQAGAHMNTEECRDDICFREPIFSFSTDDKAEENLSCGDDACPNIWHNEDIRKGESSRPGQETAWFRSQEKGQAEFVTVNGNVQVEGETCTNKGPVDDRHENSSGNSVNTHNEDQGTNDSYGWFDVTGGAKQNECAGECLGEKGKRNMKASCHSSSQSAYCDDEESDSYRSQVSGEADMPERVFTRDCNHVIFQKKSCSSNDGSDKGDIIGMSSTNCNPEVNHEEAQEKPEQLMKGSCSMKEKEPVVESASKAQSNEKRDSDGSPVVQDSIINGREKLKETDEYRQAQEEEWASRQRQLQLQAEEVQRLRKKRRAEAQRILDMEMRQKQRVEEMRKTQQKDEENMSLKEKLRAEIRKELSVLEMSCIDMPSLLRGLGIHVGTSPSPLSQEVHSAYKRALFRFHPDRASRNDIRQQVEAEEKFKLISRMKEKFLLTSCH